MLRSPTEKVPRIFCLAAHTRTDLWSWLAIQRSRSRSPLWILIGAGKIISPDGVGTFVIENNGVGLDFGLDGSALLVGGLTVRKNGTGVRTTNGAGVLTFISIPSNPSAITGNGVDVDLRFGARATIEGVDVGTITCDSTVLSRGTTVCP